MAEYKSAYELPESCRALMRYDGIVKLDWERGASRRSYRCSHCGRYWVSPWVSDAVKMWGNFQWLYDLTVRMDLQSIQERGFGI